MDRDTLLAKLRSNDQQLIRLSQDFQDLDAVFQDLDAKIQRMDKLKEDQRLERQISELAQKFTSYNEEMKRIKEELEKDKSENNEWLIKLMNLESDETSPEKLLNQEIIADDELVSEFLEIHKQAQS